jgi:hypothetical protein
MSDLSRRDFLATLAVTQIPIAAGAQAPKTSGRAPLEMSHLRYEGLFHMPIDDPAGAKTRFGYSLGAITHRYVNDQLRLIVGGAEQRASGGDYNRVGCAPYEITVPSPDMSAANAPRATLVKNWSVPDYQTKRISGNKAETSVRGFWYDEARQGLWAAYGDTYNVAGWHDPSILFLAADGRVYGPWRTQEHSQRTRGFLVPLPPDLAGGRRFAVGAPPTSGNANGPVGLMLYALADFDPRTRPADGLLASPASSARNAIACLPLAHYDGSHPQDRKAAGPYKVCNWRVLYDCGKGSTVKDGEPTFNNNDLRLDLWSAAAYVQTDAVEGLLTLGQLTGVVPGVVYPTDGMPHLWYGPTNLVDGQSGRCCHGHVGSSGGTGPMSTSQRAMLSTYGRDTLQKAAQGAIRPWALTPTTDLANPGTLANGLFSSINSSAYCIGGATFDPVSRRLFVTENYAETVGEPRSVVHVFSVRA